MRRACFVIASVLASACATARPAASTGAAESASVAPKVVPRWVPSPPPASLATVPRHEPVARQQHLANGLEVVVVEHHARPQVSLRLYFPNGAAADSDERAGVTWFTVSTLLGGFEQRGPDGELADPDEKSARRQVLEAGATLRFDVQPDAAWVGIDGFSVDTAKYLERLFRVVRDGRHGEDSFAMQAQAVADSLEELELTDGAALEQFLGRLSFGERHPYARPVQGTPASVDHLGVEDLLDRQATLLVPNGATLLIAGDVDAATVLRLAERTFGTWRSRKRPSAVKLPKPAVKKRTAVTFVPRKPAKTLLVCAARPLSDVKASEAELQVLATVLRRRLSQSLREEHGYTYTVAGSLLALDQARALLFCSRLDAAQAEPSVRSFLETLGAGVARPPEPAEVDVARAALIADNDAAADELSGVLRLWDRAIVTGEPVSLSAHADALRAVTPESLAPLARQVLKPELFQLVMSGERATVAPVAKALALGPLRTPKLSRAPAD